MPVHHQRSAKTAGSRGQCHACSSPAPRFRCGLCRSVFYCNAACQEVHWTQGHSGECRSLSFGEAPSALTPARAGRVARLFAQVEEAENINLGGPVSAITLLEGGEWLHERLVQNYRVAEFIIRHNTELDDVFTIDDFIEQSDTWKIDQKELRQLPRNLFEVLEYDKMGACTRARSTTRGVVIEDCDNEGHAFFLQLMLSRLHDFEYTPNIRKVHGLQADITGLIRRAKTTRVVLESPGVSLWRFLKGQEGNALRDTLGLPPVDLTSDFGEFECSPDFLNKTSATARFFTSLVHQITATLAVLDEQCEVQLSNLTFNNIFIKASDDPSLPTYTGEEMKTLENFKYTIGGRNVDVPNMGFVVKLQNFSAASAKFDYTTYPGSDVRFPDAGKMQYSRIPDAWKLFPDEEEPLIAVFAPRAWRRFWKSRRDNIYTAGHDLLFLMNIASQVKMFALFEQAVVQQYFVGEMRRHAFVFGNLKNMRVRSFDESILLSLNQMGWVPGEGELIQGSFATPTQNIQTRPQQFLEEAIFKGTGPTAYPGRSLAAASVVPANIDDLAKLRGKSFADLTAVQQAGTGVLQLRKDVFTESIRIRDLFGKAPKISALQDLTTASPSFIARGSQGFIHAVKIKHDGVKKLGALKSFKTLTGTGVECPRLSGNNITCSEVVNEMLVSSVTSWLYEAGVCPNFVQIYSVFTAARERSRFNPLFWSSGPAGEPVSDTVEANMQRFILGVIPNFLGQDSFFVVRARRIVRDHMLDLLETGQVTGTVADQIPSLVENLGNDTRADLGLIEAAATVFVISGIDEDLANAILVLMYDFAETRETILTQETLTSRVDVLSSTAEAWRGSADGKKFASYAEEVGEAVKIAPSTDKDVYTVMELVNGDLNGFAKIAAALQNALYKEGVAPEDIPDADQYFENAMQQTVLALYLFQYYFNGTHADFHPGNVFIKYCDSTLYDGKPLKEYEEFVYHMHGETYRVPNLGFIVKIGDMGHATLNIGRDQAEATDLGIMPELETIMARKTVHKEVVGKWRTWILSSFTDFVSRAFSQLEGALKAVQFPVTFPEWVRIPAVLEAISIAQRVRDTGMFYEAFDLATLMNNVAASADFFRHPIVALYGCMERDAQIEEFGEAKYYTRFFPSTFVALSTTFVSLYLPRSTNNIITPRTMIESDWLKDIRDP